VTTTPLVTAMREVAEAMALCDEGYAGNLVALAHIAEVGPTIILQGMNRLKELGADHPEMAALADSCDNANSAQGNLGALHVISDHAPAVAAYADELESVEP